MVVLLEKMPHVKNPLSVVAMFAGIAEVSGAVVLPLLEKDIQFIFVWFLMAFPSLLVILFFGTLNWNHTVLYAPSDFKDENNFTLFTKAPSAALRNKAQEDAAEAVLEESAQLQDNDDPESVSIPDIDGMPPDPEGKLGSLEAADKASFGETLQRSRLVTELVLTYIQTSRDLKLNRDISVASDPTIVFDAVGAGNGELVFVEVKYTRSANFRYEMVKKIFDRVEKARQDVPHNSAVGRHFRLILVYVTGDSVGKARMDALSRTAKEIAASFSFATEVHVFRYTGLIEMTAQQAAKIFRI